MSLQSSVAIAKVTSQVYGNAKFSRSSPENY